jgi:Resolvase, N terminal domain
MRDQQPTQRWPLATASYFTSSHTRRRPSSRTRISLCSSRMLAPLRCGNGLGRRSARAFAGGLIGSMQELHGAKVDLFIHQQGPDTTTASGRAMFGMLGVFSEFEH